MQFILHAHSIYVYTILLQFIDFFWMIYFDFFLISVTGSLIYYVYFHFQFIGCIHFSSIFHAILGFF